MRSPFPVHALRCSTTKGDFVRSPSCNHKGGPLSQGACSGEYVKCPWHGWEYSVVTGRGPTGFDEEQVAHYDIDERDDGVYVRTPAVEPKRLKKHKRSHLLDAHPKSPGGPPRVLGISTTAMDDTNPRYSTSDALLEHALAHAESTGAETSRIRLRELDFAPCEGNYSKAAAACTWPCAITERDPDDGLTPVYEALVHWADIVLVSTPIRWGAASGLYFKMAERLNCVQNQITTHGNVLIVDKVAAFIITGGQDNIQAVAGSMLGFFGNWVSCSRRSRTLLIREGGVPRTCRTTSASCARATTCAAPPLSLRNAALPCGSCWPQERRRAHRWVWAHRSRSLAARAVVAMTSPAVDVTARAQGRRQTAHAWPPTGR